MPAQISLTSTSDLKAKAQEILNIAEEFSTTLDLVNTDVDGITENWKDENGQVFRTKYDEISSKFTGFKENLKTMGELIDKEARDIDEMLAQEAAELNAARQEVQ